MKTVDIRISDNARRSKIYQKKWCDKNTNDKDNSLNKMWNIVKSLYLVFRRPKDI